MRHCNLDVAAALLCRAMTFVLDRNIAEFKPVYFAGFDDQTRQAADASSQSQYLDLVWCFAVFCGSKANDCACAVVHWQRERGPPCCSLFGDSIVWRDAVELMFLCYAHLKLLLGFPYGPLIC